MTLRVVLLKISFKSIYVGISDVTGSIIVNSFLSVNVSISFCFFAKSKIAKLYVSTIVNEDIIRLQITVDEVFLVDTFDGEDLL